MNTTRRRISGRLEHVPRGVAVVTDTGEHWVIEGYDPTTADFAREVTAEGVMVGLDRIRVEWLGQAPA
jgi:hypothetical protein